MTVILQEPELIKQKKLSSCWFACLKMMLNWHTGSRSVGNAEVSALSNWFSGRAFAEIPTGFLASKNIIYEYRNFGAADEIESLLMSSGPFVGGGKVGKFLGKRSFGHAILIYGVDADGHILHHDPADGAAKKMKVSSYLDKQDGERLRMRSQNANVQVAGIGS